MSKIKLIATDIDGTILKYNFQFNPAIIDCVKNLIKSGVKVVLVTGRMHEATKIIVDKLSIETPVASYQGGLIKYNGETLYERVLDVESARKILKLVKKDNMHVNLYLDDELYVEKDDEIIRNYVKQGISHFNVKSFDKIDLDSVNINKMLLVDFKNRDKIAKWEKYLKENFPNLSIVNSTPYFCEISHKEATKFHAVDFLMKHWGLKKDEVMTIGDQNNDIDLLKAGGVKVAMGNATPELKSVADFITDTVDNDGFVKAVERFVYENANV